MNARELRMYTRSVKRWLGTKEGRDHIRLALIPVIYILGCVLTQGRH